MLNLFKKKHQAVEDSKSGNLKYKNKKQSSSDDGDCPMCKVSPDIIEKLKGEREEKKDKGGCC